MMQLSAALALLAVPLAAALEPISVQGRYFVDSKGERFQIVGVDYQPGGEGGFKPEEGKDPLADPDACRRDAALLQVLGVNTIRVYNLAPELNHDECASIFDAAGMYMAIDVNAPNFPNSLPRDKPYEGYFEGYLERIFGIVEGFKDYPNTLLFFANNELINNEETGVLGPRYIRAVTRDLKMYIQNHASRKIPVGYSAADFRDTLFDSWRYFTCRIEDEEDDISQADFFGLNSYSWCGESSYKESTYEELVDNMKDTAVPIFFSEYGCNEVRPRIFQEIGAVYSQPMSDVFSGGLVYEYTFEENEYGIVQVADDGSVQVLKDFNTLAEQLKKLDMSKVQGGAMSNSPQAPVCEESLIEDKVFDRNFTLPPLPADDSDKLIANGIPNAPVGKLMQVSDFSVPYDVMNSQNETITGLQVKPRDTPNVPGFNTALDTSADAANVPDAPEGDDKEDAGSLVRPCGIVLLLLPLAAIFL